jgi:hypothetical protein
MQCSDSQLSNVQLLFPSLDVSEGGGEDDPGLIVPLGEVGGSVSLYSACIRSRAR